MNRVPRVTGAALRESRACLALPGVRRALWVGLLLSVTLLMLAYGAFLAFIDTLDPETLVLPGAGRVTGLGTLLSPASLAFAVGLSVLIMPAAAAPFAPLFLREIDAAASRAREQHMPPAMARGGGDLLVETANAAGAMVAVTAGALMLVPVVPAGAVLALWLAGGWVLARTYTRTALRRHLDAAAARAVLGRHRWRLWLCGTVFAALLSVPLLNLAMPGLGALFFGRLARALPQAGG